MDRVAGFESGRTRWFYPLLGVTLWITQDVGEGRIRGGQYCCARGGESWHNFP
ncbi:hypothetical protein RV134_280068 [Roseovarius sp. EC-HK134]|nr:hypothetical protein RV134_280068 [Roseovarius sp. EC-HK134]